MNHNEVREIDMRFAGPPARVSVNGLRLEDVEIRIDDHRVDAPARFATFTRDQFRVAREGETLLLRIPALTALQLFADGMLSAGRDRAVEVSINERKTEAYRVEGVRQVPDRLRRRGLVMVRLVRV